MPDTIIQLSSEEIDSLKIFREQQLKRFWKLSSYMVIGMFVFSLIPIGLIPGRGKVDSSLWNASIMSGLGLKWWSILFITICGTMVLAIFADAKPNKLKKDIHEGQKILLDAIIYKIVNEPKHNIYSLLIKSENIKKIVVNVDQNAINKFHVGQKLSFEVYKNSHFRVLK